MKLKFGLQIAQFQNAIAIQIFEQQLPYDNEEVWDGSCNLVLAVASEPELAGDTFYLRGDHKNADEKICPKRFDSRAKKEEFMRDLLATFEEWANEEDAKFTVKDLGHTIIMHVEAP